MKRSSVSSSIRKRRQRQSDLVVCPLKNFRRASLVYILSAPGETSYPRAPVSLFSFFFTVLYLLLVVVVAVGTYSTYPTSHHPQLPSSSFLALLHIQSSVDCRSVITSVGTEQPCTNHIGKRRKRARARFKTKQDENLRLLLL